MKDKVVKAARELGLKVDVKTLDQPTRTVAEAAGAVGCIEAQIAKTLVFVADGDPVLVVASGAHRVDTEALCEIFDVAEVRQAGPDEVRVATGYPVGGVSPLGCHLPIAFDETLLDYDCVFAAGGDGNTLFQVNPRLLADSLHAKVVRVAEEPAAVEPPAAA
jgi:prolyl-tRNA editing enzyme YbaK/EbsC (Cys-tRNA(Pro) deacylase)